MEAVLITQLNILRLFEMKPNFSELTRYYGMDRRTVKNIMKAMKVSQKQETKLVC